MCKVYLLPLEAVAVAGPWWAPRQPLTTQAQCLFYSLGVKGGWCWGSVPKWFRLQLLQASPLLATALGTHSQAGRAEVLGALRAGSELRVICFGVSETVLPDV